MSLPRDLLAAGRPGNWWSAKIPPLLAVGYAGLLVGQSSAAGLRTLLALVLAACAVEAYGHAINDAFDISEDALRGKRNTMAHWPPAGRAVVCLVPAVAAFVPLVAIRAGAWAMAVIAGDLLLPTLYSWPPIRLKERGWWGVLADAGAAQLLPTLLIAGTFAPPGWRGTAFVLTAAGWAFAAGLRGILVHQVRDREADLGAGVRTYGGLAGADRVRRLVLGALLPTEAAALVAFVLLLAPHAPALAGIGVLFAALEWARRRAGWTLPLFEPAASSREPYLPLANNEFYEVWLPLALAMDVGLAGGGALLALPAFHLLAFLPNVRRRAGALWSLTRAVPRRVRPRAVPRGAPVVVLLAPSWTLNGVNVFSLNLVRGLRKAGVDARVLLTEEHTALVNPVEAAMPKPGDVPFESLPVRRLAGWGAHWGATIRYLESLAPCVCIPNSDYRHSCVAPRLSPGVALIGVVHSDDPLHYDHVARLGATWDAIVAVSEALREKTAARYPEIAGRLTTIPIGVAVPASQPQRAGTGAGPLEVVYHGTLKQYQKRVLDLPRVVAAAVARGVDLRLSIAGGGPDEGALREASAPLVAGGHIRFLGVVPHDEMPAVLEASDVYLLTSEFEGLPNALLEAMGRGCVPVVSRMESGIPQVVRDGDTGYLVPTGDIEGFAERLALLSRDTAARRAMASRAYAAVSHGTYRSSDMVRDYLAVIHRVLARGPGAFRRPAGEICPPPANVDGVSVFPVPLPHHEPGVGPFPSRAEARAYQVELQTSGAAARGAGAGARALRGVQVVVAAPVWTVNGVNRASEALVRGLRAAGVRARLVLTEETTHLVTIDAPRLARPTGVPVDEMTLGHRAGWGARWGAMTHYLERRAPCIWLPTFDWRHSCVAPLLPPDVVIVGTVGEPSALHLDHARRLGPYWNAVVTPDAATARAVEESAPAVAARLTIIPLARRLPARPPTPRTANPLRLGICDLGGGRWPVEPAALRAELAARGARVSVVELDAAAVADDQDRVGAVDVLLARWQTAYPPDALWEAIARGCVPVVAASGGATPGVPHDHRLAAMIAPDDVPGLVERLDALQRAPAERDSMAAAGYARVRRDSITIEDVVAAWIELFELTLMEKATGRFVRPGGELTPPPARVSGVDVLPVPFEHHESGVGVFPTARDAVAFRRSRRFGRWARLP